MLVHEPGQETSPRPKPLSPVRSHDCGERSARTKPSLPPNRISHCERGLFPRPNLLRFPDIFLEGSPKENSRQATIRREPLRHGAAMQCSQLKTNLEFLIRI